VLVFEPNAAVLPALQQNLAANGVARRVEILSAALAERAGRASFYASGETSSLVEAVEGTVRVEVDLVRGDDVVDEDVDVIKLDIEGAELAALRGMERLVAGVRTIFLELNPGLLKRSGASRDELLRWLVEHGFEVEWIDEDNGVTAPLPEPSSEAYVNIVGRRTA